MTLPKTTERVEKHTSPRVNRMIRERMERRVAAYAAAGGPAMDDRLRELDEEWDIERALETNGSALILAGVLLSALVSRKWLLLPGFVGAFCLQHALQGWCPPIEIFRRLGVRTSREIDEERTALKALRGDFKLVTQKPNGQGAREAMLAAAR